MTIIIKEYSDGASSTAEQPQPALPYNDAPYLEKVSELLALLEADHVPPRIKISVPSLSQVHQKLFCWVAEDNFTFGTPNLSPGLHPSDFLCELVEALRALDWPKVMVLVHSVIPKSINGNQE